MTDPTPTTPEKYPRMAELMPGFTKGAGGAVGHVLAAAKALDDGFAHVAMCQLSLAWLHLDAARKTVDEICGLAVRAEIEREAGK